MSTCPFCDRQTFAERIIAEDEHFWAIASLGQIAKGYVLLFPKYHTSCLGSLLLADVIHLGKLLLSVQDVIQQEFRLPTAVFEHGIIGQTVPHAHLHLVPTRVDLEGIVHEDFPDTTFRMFDTMTEALLCMSRSKTTPYLLWRRGGMCTMTCVWYDPPAPRAYFRNILAERLNCPERADWRTMDKEMDKQLWTETLKRLKPYF